MNTAASKTTNQWWAWNSWLNANLCCRSRRTW